MLLVLFITTFLSACIYYSLRHVSMLNDAAIILFKIANNSDFSIPKLRMSHILTQFMPVLGSKLGASMKTIVILYNLNEFLFMMLPAFLSYLFRKPALLFASILSFITCQGNDILCLGMEITYTAPLIIIWIIWFELTSKRPVLFLSGYTIITYFLVLNHVMSIPTFLTSVGFYLIYTGQVKATLRSYVPWGALPIFFILVFCRVMTFSTYDTGRMREYYAPFSLNLSSTLTDWIHSFNPHVSTYLLFMLVSIVLIYFFILREKKTVSDLHSAGDLLSIRYGMYYLALLVITFPLLMIILFGGSFSHSLIVSVFSHKNLLPSLFVVTLALSYLLERLWKGQKKYQQWLIVLFLTGLSLIHYRVAQYYFSENMAGESRLTLYMDLLKKAEASEGQKFYYSIDSLLNPQAFMPGYHYLEATVLGSYLSFKKSISIAIVNEEEIHFIKELPDSSIFIGFGDVYSTKQFNPEYFQFAIEPYKSL